MTPAEWARFALWLDGAFPQDFDAKAEAAWHMEISDVPFEEAVRAVRLAAQRSGRPDFRPGAVAVRVALAGPRQTEDFAEAWRTMTDGWRALGKRTDDATSRRVAEGLLGRGFPAMARLVSQRGLASLMAEHVDDPEYGGAVRHRLEQAHARAAEAIEDGGRALVASSSAGELVRGPRSLDAARLLTAGQ